MKFNLAQGAFALTTLLATAAAQAAYYTDPATGIKFWQQTITPDQTTGGFQFGYVLPGTAAERSDEYIGHMVGAINSGTGWSGITHGTGMPNSLLLLGWVDGTNIRTSFRYAAGYVTPDIYTGNATLTQIAHTINSTHWTLTYRCQWCWYWDQGGATGSQPSTQDVQVLGWVQAFPNPVPTTDNNAVIVQHDNGMGQWGMVPASARNTMYSTWATKGATSAPASSTPTGTATATSKPVTTTTASPVAACTGSAVPSGTYDYIIVGAGAGGIPLADKLSESGKSVLLVERGPPSSGRWGGTMKPSWLTGTNLTRFDVPGLCNQIWVDSAGIACADMDQMAGCVLGGGTAVNAALWWKPPAIDWDYNFPTGWKSTDMSSAVSRVFSRIPGTDHPSADGKLYLQQGYDVVSSALAASGWKNVVANDVPDQKNQVYAHTPYMYSHGERGGPMATYLVTASARKNFKLMMNASVRRVVRTGGHATGVEFEGGYCGTINVTANTGRVILSAGTFGSSKILFRSGIGPTDMLQVVNGSADGKTMIGSADWINLPVGNNLNDHVNTDVVIKHPNVTFYDFYAAYTNPITADKNAYLNGRTGILTQSAPNIGPMFWQTIAGSDGVTRQLQWTARVEGSLGATDNTSMTLSQYLGRGSTSRGRTTITGALTMTVSDIPYLKTAGDKAAVITGIQNLLNALAKIPNIVLQSPAPGQSATDYVNAYPITTGGRRANHWIGTSKIGTDNGLLNGGTAVVDTNTRVYGMDNLFVVDASIFPGMMTTNPSALIVSVAEHASEKILALPALSAVPLNGQCGGASYTGARFCASGLKCKYSNSDYSQCLAA